MIIVRYQIHCLVSKNDAVVIVIDDDCDATMFQCRGAQEKFAHVHHVKCNLDQNSSTAVRHHMSVNHFFVRSVAVPRCSLPQLQRLWNSPLEIVVQTRVGRHVQNIQNRSSNRAPQSCSKTDLPNSSCTDVSCCLPARISRVPHLRFQSCSFETNFDGGADVFVVQVSSTCLLLSLSLISVTLDFDFSEPLPAP